MALPSAIVPPKSTVYTNIYGVTADERGGFMNAVRMLAAKGRKNLVFITNRLTPSNREKLEGFKAGVKLYLDNGRPDFVEVESGSIGDIEQATCNVLKTRPKTDAILYSEDFIALAGLHALYELGIKVPDQVAVLGMNNSRYAGISNPTLTSIDNMLYDTSLIAVRNLLDVLNGERVNHRMSIGSELVERSST